MGTVPIRVADVDLRLHVAASPHGPRRVRRRLAGAALATAVAGIAVGACSSARTSSSTASPSTAASALADANAPSKTLTIVAGENFWGSIVTQLAGKAGNVTSIVTDPNADPH